MDEAAIIISETFLFLQGSFRAIAGVAISCWAIILRIFRWSILPLGMRSWVCQYAEVTELLPFQYLGQIPSDLLLFLVDEVWS